MRCFHIALMALAAVILALASCTKETTRVEPDEVNFPNPFENGGTAPTFPTVLDSSSFTGIYNNILSMKCGANNGACHDGSFEPDFRTLFSSYNTLVYHKPIKNVIASIVGNDTTWVYPYRVTPGDPDISWLYHRITTDDEELGRMPLYDQPLSDVEINHIRQWILDGAKDPFGNTPQLSAPEPQFFGWLAFENDQNGVRLDTARATLFEPAVFPANTQVMMWFGAVDYNVQGDVVFPILPLGYQKIRIANHPYTFGSAPEVNMQLDFTMLHPSPIFTLGFDLPFYHRFTINTADYEPGEVYYIRVYWQGAQQGQPTEFPQADTQIFWILHMSFTVEE